MSSTINVDNTLWLKAGHCNRHGRAPSTYQQGNERPLGVGGSARGPEPLLPHWGGAGPSGTAHSPVFPPSLWPCFPLLVWPLTYPLASSLCLHSTPQEGKPFWPSHWHPRPEVPSNLSDGSLHPHGRCLPPHNPRNLFFCGWIDLHKMRI